MESLERLIKDRFPEVEFEFFQSNIEGELIDQIHKCGKEKATGLILNPGGFSHNSVSIHDAIKCPRGSRGRGSPDKFINSRKLLDKT